VQVAPRADWQPGHAERSDSNPRQLIDRNPGEVHHAADDVIHPLVERDRENNAFPGFTHDAEFVRNDSFTFDLDSTAHPLQHAWIGEFRRQDVIFLFESETGVHDAIGEFAVVGQEQQALGLTVEPSNRIEAFASVDEFHNGMAVALVAGGRDVPPRFVQHHIAPPLRTNDLAVNPDDVGFGIGFGAELGNRVSVDRNPAGHDHLFRDATRGDASGGENALQALHTEWVSLTSGPASRGAENFRWPTDKRGARL